MIHLELTAWSMISTCTEKALDGSTTVIAGVRVEQQSLLIQANCVKGALEEVKRICCLCAQEELMFLLRKLVVYFRQLPAQTAHSIFNYLVCPHGGVSFRLYFCFSYMV